MKKIYFLVFISYILTSNSSVALDYEKASKICKDRGLSPNTREYWDCIDKQRDISETKRFSKKERSDYSKFTPETNYRLQNFKIQKDNRENLKRKNENSSNNKKPLLSIKN